MNKRYMRNMKTLSAEENERLRTFKVCVAGCGGLGGYIIEELGRLGIGTITAIDGDVFEETNLNRQILSSVDLLGKSKAETAKSRMLSVNPDIDVKPVKARITDENCSELIKGHDIVMDAVDNAAARRLLEEHCGRLGIPMIHGAIGGWYGQVSAVFPGDGTIKKLYPNDSVKGAEAELGNPAFTPAVVASIQVAEAIKVLLGRGSVLRNKLLCINLLDHEYEVFSL